MVYYIYMVPPKKNCSFTIFTGIYSVFWHILGDIFNVFKIKLDIVSRGRTIYICITVDVDKLVRHDGSGIKKS